MNAPNQTEGRRYVATGKKRLLHRLFRILLFLLTVLSAYVFHFRDSQRTNDRHSKLTDMVESKRSAMVPSKVLLEKYSLTEEQCKRRFPGLLEGVEDVLLIDDGHHDTGRVRSVEGRIRGGDLWVAPEKDVPMIQGPNPINRLQIDAPVTSSVARPMTPRKMGPTWPHSSPTHSIPTKWRSRRLQIWTVSSRYLQSSISKVSNISWTQLTHHYRSLFERYLLNPKLKRASTSQKPVSEKTWVKLEDFCRYGYIIHTGDTQYSTGRSPYLQVCHLVIVPPSPKYLDRTNHLAQSFHRARQHAFGMNTNRPLIAPPQLPTLPSPPDVESNPTPSKSNALSIPHIPDSDTPLPPSETILVKPDWSDLETTIAFLKAYPEIAEAISKHEKDDVVIEYHNPAAEVCLKRALARGWGSRKAPDIEKVGDGATRVMEARWTGRIGALDTDTEGGILEVGVGKSS
ncbi:hypothetical protein BJ508DRAFT_380895 [Ascobolus immersus RN42]|uniref:Uncharacterized protein n=1 Tax=Ascobolus immersus RN42 TaxID=1160509 RepID=A0A3N4HP33_ASCIM|nr:hypothetical protein BJ508DRAFT_380895 [Ascobolus immersus RN42]